MKTIIFLIILTSMNYFALAQSIGITNEASFTPDASSVLEIKSTNKGVIFPNVSLTSLTDATTITSPATGLLIYNTNSALAGDVGFYYNSGTSGSPTWTRLANNDGTVALERNPMGEFYMEGNSTVTTCAVQSTFYKVAGTTTFNSGYQMDNGGGDNRLRYTGPNPKMFHVACTFSIQTAVANKDVKLKIYKYTAATTSYSALGNSVVHIKISQTTDLVSTAIHVMVSLANGDYLELRVANNTSADDFTITDMNMFAMGVSMGMD